MANLSNFNERLTELMEDRNIKSEELSKLVGVTGSVVRRWTFNDTNIKLSNLVSLAEFFNCSIEFLVGRSDKVIDFQPKAYPSFYQALQNTLKYFGKSIYRIDKETKIKGSYLHKWKNGADPQLSSLIELSDYLGCTIDFLIGRE